MKLCGCSKRKPALKLTPTQDVARTYGSRTSFEPAQRVSFGGQIVGRVFGLHAAQSFGWSKAPEVWKTYATETTWCLAGRHRR